eukprot:TRINITY_DN32609_c0_g2_i1.p1 TRINITY_DN32609_c0_g2~~TRINITY_DN32609_c0_g2_i1.p1  ORF type:complete len:630 (-),score=85.45 TRINITY_DN32609_c0_g2_i1:128-2017(-)
MADKKVAKGAGRLCSCSLLLSRQLACLWPAPFRAPGQRRFHPGEANRRPEAWGPSVGKGEDLKASPVLPAAALDTAPSVNAEKVVWGSSSGASTDEAPPSCERSTVRSGTFGNEGCLRVGTKGSSYQEDLSDTRRQTQETSDELSESSPRHIASPRGCGGSLSPLARTPTVQSVGSVGSSVGGVIVISASNGGPARGGPSVPPVLSVGPGSCSSGGHCSQGGSGNANSPRMAQTTRGHRSSSASSITLPLGGLVAPLSQRPSIAGSSCDSVSGRSTRKYPSADHWEVQSTNASGPDDDGPYPSSRRLSACTMASGGDWLQDGAILQARQPRPTKDVLLSARSVFSLGAPVARGHLLGNSSCSEKEKDSFSEGLSTISLGSSSLLPPLPMFSSDGSAGMNQDDTPDRTDVTPRQEDAKDDGNELQTSGGIAKVSVVSLEEPDRTTRTPMSPTSPQSPRIDPDNSASFDLLSDGQASTTMPEEVLSDAAEPPEASGMGNLHSIEGLEFHLEKPFEGLDVILEEEAWEPGGSESKGGRRVNPFSSAGRGSGLARVDEPQPRSCQNGLGPLARLSGVQAAPSSWGPLTSLETFSVERLSPSLCQGAASSSRAEGFLTPLCESSVTTSSEGEPP